MRTRLVSLSSLSSSSSSLLSTPSPSLSVKSLPPPTQPPVPSQFSVLSPTPLSEHVPGTLLDPFGPPGRSSYTTPFLAELHLIRQRNRELEIENTKLVAERDSLMNVIERLSGGNANSIGPSTPLPTPESHSNIRFWTASAYETWLTTPEAQRAKQGKEPYLEEENGDPVSDSRLKNIRECLRSGWCELVRRNLAPSVWGDLTAEGKQIFHTYVENCWPLFRCAELGWKLDRLARTSYSAWRRVRVDEAGRWLSKEERKRKVKFEMDLEDRAKSIGIKRPKVDFTSSISFNDTKTFEPVTNPTTPTPTETILPPAGLLSTLSSDSISTSNSHIPETIIDPVLDGDSDSLAVPSTSFTSNSTMSLPSEVPTGDFTSTSSTSQTIIIEHKNPLSELASVAAGLGINIPDITQDTLSAANTTATTGKVPNSSQAPSGGLKKTSKMRPGPVRNGRNLCAHRWLRAFKDSSNGTTNEFKDYYNALSKEQREAYDKEAASLVTNNAWNKDVYLGKIY